MVRGRRAILNKVRVWLSLGVGVCCAALFGVQSAWAYTMDANQTVTVGLLFRTGSFDTSVDTVHLNSSSGLFIGFNGTSGFVGAYTPTDGNHSVAVSLDDFFLIVGETQNSVQAKGWQGALTQAGYSADVMVLSRGGQTIYRVVQGYYETVDQANGHLAAVSKLVGNAAKLGGWYRLATGAYSSISTASAEVTVLQNKGFDTYPVIRQSATGGAISYTVWIGGQASSADLTVLQSQLHAALPTLAVTAADESPNYALIEKDAAWTNGGSVPLVDEHLYIESTSEQLVVQANSASGSTPVVGVAESEGRRYRGQIMLQGYKQRLAVVNRLPVDDYLYGVVPQEMSTGWPIEALKAQAVAARTYVLEQPADKYGICQVSDDTYDQAYRGYDRESTDTNQAVDDTHGQVLLYNNGTPSDTSDDVMAQALYSSDHGGVSADPSEVWGTSVPYLHPVPSPYDNTEQQSEPIWYRVEFPTGVVGYMRHDLVDLTGSDNGIGLPLGTVNTDQANVRATSNLYGTVEQTAAANTSVVIVGQSHEYGVYSWQTGPYTALELEQLLNNNMPSGDSPLQSPVTHLQLTTGPSKRVIAVSADGQPIPVPYPFYMLQLFGNINSNLFTVEETATVSVQGASVTAKYPESGGGSTKLNALSAGGAVRAADAGAGSFVILGANNVVRVATIQPTFIIHGHGWGHGLGMSQWGAYGMAKALDSQGNHLYTYIDILQHYYSKDCYVTPKVSQ